MSDAVKFLLVDDINENLVALEALLRRDGLEMMTARSGPEALELLLLHNFALALIDVQMPGMDGFELAELMRGTERTRRIPIIMLTAVASDEQRRFKGYEAGAVDYLVKPIDSHMLRRKAEVFFELDRQRRELVRQRDEIEASEERFRRSLLMAPTPMLVFDDRGEIVIVNAEWLGRTGYGHGELRAIGDVAERLCGDRAAEVLACVEEVTRAGAERARIECDVATKGGVTLTWDFTVSALGPASRGRRLFIGLAHDLTERRQAERTQQLLIGELNHRVKNTLATVQAIAQQTLRQTRDPDRFAASFSGRILALSQAHSLLSDGTWQGADVRELIRGQISLGAVDEARFSASGPAVRLKPQIALHVALMLHELTTNAVKYGALSCQGGSILVTWTAEGGCLRLQWTEHTNRPVRAPSRRGFGSTLIERGAKGNGGSAAVRYETGGVVWDIVLPLAPSGSDDLPFRMTSGVPAGAPPERAPNEVPARLEGRRFLVVEDEPLIALNVVANLEQVGAVVAAQASTVEEALDLIDSLPLDAALLDGNLGGEPVDAVAAALARRDVPFLFVTGYGRESLPGGFGSAGVLAKPFTEAQLIAAASALIRKPAGTASGIRDRAGRPHDENREAGAFEPFDGALGAMPESG